MEVVLLKKFIASSLILIIILIAFASFAEESLSISKWYVDSTLLENGDLQVEEYLKFDFNDDFNGVYRSIVLERIDDVYDLRVYEVVNGNEVEFVLNEKAKNGDTNVYNYEIKNNQLRLKIFSPSEDEQKTFGIKYTLKNVATLHKDTGELYYKFLGQENETPIRNFSVDIKLPQFDRDIIKIFGHGPLNGVINFSNDNLIRLEVDNIPSNTFIEARVLYPIEYTPLSNRAGNKTLTDILQEEKMFQEEIETKQAKKEKAKGILNQISLVIWAIGILVTGYIVRKFRRNPDMYNNMDSLYPKDLSPAELNLFMNSMINSRGIMATIFDLARRGYLTIDESEDLSAKRKYRKQDFVFIKTGKSDFEILKHEAYLLDWLFNEIGDGSKVSTNDIDVYRSKKSVAFSKKYNSWMSLVRKELEAKGYNDPSATKYGFGLMFLSFIALIIGIISVVNSAVYGIGVILIGAFFFIYGVILLTRKSDEGYIQYGLWKDFKKEIESLGNVDIGIPRDKNIINAIALGLNMENLDSYRENIDYNYYPMYWGLWYFTQNNKGGSVFEDKFNRSFYGAVGSTSGTSTTFGGGGGFSGGGGGGAGGGGAGGF